MAGKKFSAGANFGASGTMVDRGAPVWTPGTADQAVSAGRYTGGTVKGDPNLNASNIRSGISLFGVIGNVDRKSSGGRKAEIYVHGDGGPIAGLARGIISTVGSVMGFHGQAVRDGGPNGTGFAVICNTQADAMLLEIGFIDSDDLAKIKKRIDDFAPLIARAFCEFYGEASPNAHRPSIRSPPRRSSPRSAHCTVPPSLRLASPTTAQPTPCAAP